MRWNKKFKDDPKDKDTRIITKFLFFPKCIDGEYRWLELARIEQLYSEYDWEYDMGGYWIDRCWVD